MYVICAIFGYLIGSFPMGVVLSRRKYGLDVRDLGSGNIGATNVTRVFGWYAGVLTFVVDFFKGYLPLWLLHRYFPANGWLLTVTGVALVLGHCFSLYIKFRGGKGVATSLGCITFVAPWCAAIAGLLYIALLAATKISAVGSLGGILAAILYSIVAKPPLSVCALIWIVSFVVVLRHQSNIRRLLGLSSAKS